MGPMMLVLAAAICAIAPPKCVRRTGNLAKACPRVSAETVCASAGGVKELANTLLEKKATNLSPWSTFGTQKRCEGPKVLGSFG